MMDAKSNILKQFQEQKCTLHNLIKNVNCVNKWTKAIVSKSCDALER